MDRDYTYKVLGCVYEVYKQLGPGLLESIYEAEHSPQKIPIFPNSLE